MDKMQLKKDLIFASLFVMVYEHFVSFWEESFLSFFANGTEFENEKIIYKFTKPQMINGKLEFVADKEKEKEYRQKVYMTVKKADNNWDANLSMFNFMLEFGLISQQDYDSLVAIRKLRNDIAHELFKVVSGGMPADASDLFNSLISIRKKANENWYKNVEIPIGDYENFIDKSGNYQEPEWVINMQDLVFDAIIEMVTDK